MRPRWQTAIIIFTTPLWIIPAMFYIGWIEGGKAYFKEFPFALRYIFKGKT
jgi:hypothetical protein